MTFIIRAILSLILVVLIWMGNMFAIKLALTLSLISNEILRYRLRWIIANKK